MNDSIKSLTSGERVGSAILSRVAPRRRYCLSSTSPPDCSAAPAGARDRDRSRRPARPGRPAATVLVVGLLLLGAAAAEAQTSRILVSNTVVADDDNANTSGNDHAQLFHTGGHTDGYILTDVLVNSEDTEGDDFDVEICEEDGSADELPSSTCTALTAPSSFTAGFVHFMHAGLALSANTNYVVVIKQRGTGSVRLKSTTNPGEDTSIGLSDWSIKNKFYWKSGSTWMIKSGSNEALRIVVRGYAVDATDATLSALSVSGTTLSPTFDAGTTTYQAVVANSVSQATITATKSQSTATVEYLDESDNTRTDADTMTAGLQVNLGVGTNTVKAKVTAPDTTTTQTYTVNVVRVAVPVACSPASMQNQIWTAQMTVGFGTVNGFAEGLYGHLDSKTITYNGTNYTVENVVRSGAGFTQGLYFTLTSNNFGAAAADLVLHVDSRQYPVSDATLDTNRYKWTNNVPSSQFSAGTGVCLALTVAGPDVSSVELTSVPNNNTWAIGEEIEATVTFSAAVDITGTPQLELDFDGTPKPAGCAAAMNTTTMVCTYTVVENDSAPNGIAIAANKLTGGTITATGSTTTADLTHTAVAIDAGHKVDGSRPTLVTTGADAPTTSTDGTQVILTFSETLSTADRTKITIGIVGGNVAQTSGASAAGTTVELDLSTFIDATVMLTVALDADAVEDGASNGNLAVPATPVTNAITANASPAFSAATATRSVPENSPASTHVGAPVTATDGDNDPLTYTLEGTAAAAFEIVSTSGQIRTTAGETYDRETQSSYAVTVKADDGNGGTDTIAVTITLTNVIEPPGRPAAPSVSSVAGSTTSLSVSWTAPSNTGPAIDTYDLEYRQGTSGSWTNGPQDVSGTSTTIAGLTANTLYQVQVLATNAEGNSPWSPSGSGQTNMAGTTQGAPDAPTSLRSTRGDQQVTLRWTAPTNDGGEPITHYEYEQDESGTWTSTGGTATRYPVTGLTNGQTYTFRVRAVNSIGASGESNQVTATPSEVTPPPAVGPPSPPRDLTAMPGDQAVALSWRRPAENGGAQIVRYEYRQQEGDGPVGAWQIIREDPPPTTHRVTGLTNGTSYTFQVRAVNNRHASPPSEPATATPEPELAPFEVTIVGVPEVAVAGASYELTAQSDAEEALVYAWRVAYGEGGSVEPTDTQTVVWTAPSGVNVAWIRVDATRGEDGATAGQSAYVRVEVADPDPDPDVPEPVPALPLLGQLLLALGLTGAGARLLSRRPRVPPAA